MDGKSKYEETALHLASYKGNADIVKLLLEYGANVDEKDKFEETALQLASQKGHVREQILMQHQQQQSQLAQVRAFWDARFDLLDGGQKVVIGGQKAIIDIRERTEGTLERHTKALANLSAVRKMSCPYLIWVIPSEGSTTNGRTWFPRNFTKKSMRLYFVCQHSFKVVEPALELEVTRTWVKDIAPVLKLSVLLLRAALAAGRLDVGLPFPNRIEGLDFQLGVFDQFIGDMLDDEWRERISKRFEKASEKDISNDGGDDGLLNGASSGDLTEVVGDAYAVLEEKANKDKYSAWKDNMESVLDKKSGSRSLIYVMKKYADQYH